MRRSMRQMISAFLFALVFALPLPVIAQLEDQPVLMDNAPFHVPIFANDYIILLSINIPPGRDTDFHTHYADSVTVELAPGIRTDQVYGSTEVSAPSAGDPVPGRTSFSNIRDNEPRTHKASNVGPTAFRAVSFILKDRDSAASPVSDRSESAGFNEIMDNERIRAWRVTLEPGQATDQITQSAPGLRVFVRGGVLDELVPGAADRGMAVIAGDVMWQEAGPTRAVRNTGATVLEFVEFEFK